MARLIDCFGSGTATTLSMLARGEDTDPVKNRALPKAIGCGKNLQWVERSMGGVQKWLEQLSAEVAQRLQEDRSQHQRVARSLTVRTPRDER